MGLRSYLGSLTWPDNVKDAVDVASKTIVAAVVAVTGFLYHHYESEQIEAARKKTVADEQLQRDLAAALSSARTRAPPTVSSSPGCPTPSQAMAPLRDWRSMIAFCNDAINAKEAIVATACKHLPAEPISASQRKEAATQAAAEPTAYANSPLAQRANIATAAAEAATPPTVGAKWFAVVGTVPLTDPDTAKALAGSLTQHLQAAGISQTVALYRTKISQSFALTIGGRLSQADATALAGRVRASGVVRDAFAQPDRDWSPAGGPMAVQRRGAVQKRAPRSWAPSVDEDALGAQN